MDELKSLSQQELQALEEKYEYNAKIFPDSETLLSLAEVYLALGKVTMARSKIFDFTLKKGETCRAHVLLAKAHLMCWNSSFAEEELKKALSIDPRNAEASALLKHIYKSSGKTGKAMRVALLHGSGSTSGEKKAESARSSEEFFPRPEKKSETQAEVFETGAMLNLYVSQGLYEDALRIVEVLCQTEPENSVYRRRREEIIAILDR